MKIPPSTHSTSRRHNGGFTVIVMLALLALVLGFLAANSEALSGLNSDLNQIEGKQIRRLSQPATSAAQNLPVAATTNGR